MSDQGSDSELGRSKKSSTPTEHLQHLLNLGWSTKSPLIQKYALKYRLESKLAEWEKLTGASSNVKNG